MLGVSQQVSYQALPWFFLSTLTKGMDRCKQFIHIPQLVAGIFADKGHAHGNIIEADMGRDSFTHRVAPWGRGLCVRC
jgi:hypothetical protein